MKKIIFLLFLLPLAFACQRTDELSAFDYNTSDTLIQVDIETTKPARGDVFMDPTFNTTFYRVSDVSADIEPGEELKSMIVYSRFSPRSYDNKYLLLQCPTGWNDALLYNATSYELIKRLPTTTTIDGVPNQSFVTMEGAELRWRRDGVNPHQFYYVGIYTGSRGMQLLNYDVDYNTATLVHDFSVNFSTQHHILNDVEGDASRDMRYWAFMVFNSYDGRTYPLYAMITYDLVSDVILGTMTVTGYKANGGYYDYLPRPNMVDMAPSGDKMVMLMPRCWGTAAYGNRPEDIESYFDGPHVWDLDFTNPVKVAADQTHSGWAYDHDGNEGWVSQNNRTDYFQFTDILTGTSFYFFNYAQWSESWAGMHFARMPSSDTLKGWVLSSTYTPSTTMEEWGDNQLLMFELVDMNVQTPIIWRLGHTWNYKPEYYAEGFAAMDDTATDIWWNGNWFGSAIETYHMVLPDNWWTALTSGEPETPPTTPRKVLIHR
jgi:hypothetical protein